MLPITLAHIANATSGRISEVSESIEVTGISYDSRKVHPGDLFVALRGNEGRDGHDHAHEAIASGASAVLASRPLGLPSVLVEDPLTALGVLARAHVEELPDLTTIAVTGSSGKTSTKDLIAQILEPAGPTVATEGSFNNEIGLPLTALETDAETRYLVAEMGARGQGHITYLTEITPPTVGVVLNVGTAHMGEFGGPEATAKAKGELVAALPSAAEGGVAVLNADDPRVAAMADRTKARIITFGTAQGADVRAVDIGLDSQGRASFTLRTRAGDCMVGLQVVGEHQVPNALAAAAAAGAVGMDVLQVGEMLSTATPVSEGRMRVVERGDGLLVVNDAYNANTDSTSAALRALAHLGRGRAGRTIALLGEMRELGDGSMEEHRKIGVLAAVLGIDTVTVVGTAEARALAEGYGPDALVLSDKDAAREWLGGQRFASGDVLLVKGAHSSRLGELADALTVG
ncbi:UDP-N-acetylmuramoyl-tripeptide--D-alanyl-D-alanine ligase [Nocardiopsis alba]|uniref:UDP-N-acetylmuramoyl-tripeptide--D-alanyl-D- alanine ligase n=1 Tax=Nocardiopsis alba TaxID=53437 RepID=UPI0035DFB25C